MNLKHALATGFLTVVAFATLTFMPASADSPVAKTVGSDVILALNSQETPQHLVWDMTYGDQDLATPSTTTASAPADDNVQDLSLG
ncbi:hypothetical protein BWI17_19985 [Betaproteobacteria bacterium GR16-43]|nr:hypothetical protein BWI17_19985 [Betaproteobacteria bacterium GR16-43]